MAGYNIGNSVVFTERWNEATANEYDNSLYVIDRIYDEELKEITREHYKKNKRVKVN